MFNLNRILNRKVDSARSPVRSASAVVDGKGGSTEVNNAEESIEGRNAEGFLCPSCFLAFPTADSLQNHYESAHPDNFTSVMVDGRVVFSCPDCKMCLGSEAELHSHYKRHHSNGKEQGEIEALRTQVTALQDGKALVVDELQALHGQMMELFKENAKIREERDTFEQKTASLAGELAYLKADVDESRSQKNCLESKLLKAEARGRELEIEIQQRPEADDVSLLKQEIVSVQKMMDQLTLQREAEKDALQRQCSNLQEFCNRLQSENASLEELLKSSPKNDDLKSMEEDISETKSKMVDLQKNFEVVSSEKNELEKRIKQFSDYDDLKRDNAHKEELLQNANRLLETKEKSIEKLNADLKAERENVERMKEGAEQLFAKIEEGEGANTAILQLKEDNARLHEQIIQEQNLVAQVKHEMEVKLESLHKELKKAKQEAEMSRLQNLELGKELSKIQSQVEHTEMENKQLNVQLTDQGRKISVMKESHKNSLLSLQTELESIKMSLSMKSAALEAAEKALQKSEALRAEQLKAEVQLKDSLKSVTTELAELKALRSSEVSKMKSKIEQSEKEKSELISKCANEKEKSALLSSQYFDLSTQHENTVSKLKDAMQQIADSQLIKSDLEAKLSQMTEEVQKNQDNEAQFLLTIGDLNEVKKQLSEKVIQCDEEVRGLKIAVDSLRHEKETILKEIEMMTSELNEKKVLCDFQENKIAELTECYQDEKENRCREVQSLESAKQLLIGQKMTLLKDMDAVKEENAKQVTNLQEKISALESEVQKAEVVNKTLTSKLENAVQSNKRSKEEWDKLQSHLEAQIGVLNENANTLREDLRAEQNRKESLEQKVDELSGSKLELEAKLDNALDERKSLLDRCLKRESECEKLQKSSVDLRRKLDDTTAALQELGRENQTLQIENTKHLARKWTDDNDVSHCTACGKLFTVTVRKHHCRNCGNIFCNECSSRTAAIASSKKPVRVCDVCYAEVSK